MGTDREVRIEATTAHARLRPGSGRWRRLAASLDASQRRTLAAMAAVIAALHIIGFFLLFVVVAPSNFSLGASGAFTVGVGIAAYTLGMRHAFDADHIAAIDNSTRKLMGEGKQPLSVGFFFSLGHSTIVFLLAFLFALGIKSLSGQVENGGSTLHDTTDWIGTGVSGTFLYVIAALNIAILAGVLRVLGEMKRGTYDEAELERQLDNRGLMNRFYKRFTKSVNQSWQMYPIGLLFGVGFDTATEVALLFLAAAGAGACLPFYAIICLPILFAAGMTLFDTIDGAFMNFAYGWAFSKPVRKVFYNITITALSVAVALLVGSIEALQVLSDRFGLTGGFWGWLNNLDFNLIGYIIVGLFVVTWAVALSVWRFGRIEERWTARLQQTEPA